MSGGMPELGSKISLISKADIRYEGRLFTVDPQECTIALANVRSFGTEDRETSYPIMPQTTVYDYILFRGSDIKDIRVVNLAVPNDPAIMHMQLPQQQQNFPPQNFPQMQQPGGAPPMAHYGGFNQMQGGPMAPQIPQSQQQQTQSPIHSQHQGNANISNLAPGSGSGQKNKKSNSRSGTPIIKSPVHDSSNQNNQSQRENQSGGNKDKSHQQNQRNNNQRNSNPQQRERRDSGRNEAQQDNKGGYRNQNPRQHNQMNNNHQQQPQQQQRGYHNNRNPNNNQMRGNQGGSARMRGGPPMHVNNYRQQNNQGAPNQNQNKPNQNGPQQQRNTNKPNTLKFDNEFDFEQANSKFEELRSELAKLKVGSEETKPSDQVNGEVEKKEDSGNETGADHEAEVEETTAYDKNKSFFDTISCEAVERSKGKTQRTDWRQERKINSETFGYSFNRRGNYRGRGGFYGNQYNRGPRQGGYRGGNQNNYRPVRNHRNQNNDGRNNAPNSSQGNGTQSQNQSAPVAAN